MLRDRVRIEPPLARDELPALIAGADALVSATQPRGSETLDKVVYEAAACGVPVLASNAALTSSSTGCPLELRFPRRATPRALAERLLALAAAGPARARGDRRGAAPPRRRRPLGRLVGGRRRGGRFRPDAGVSSWPWRPSPPSRPSSAPASATSARRGRTCSRGAPLRAFVRRALAIAVLAALDALGLALGLYAALVLRSIVFGDPIFWSLLWEAGPAEWLPFLIPITLLVFWQAGLYASRERRAGLGRVASSLVLVAAITLAFGSARTTTSRRPG